MPKFNVTVNLTRTLEASIELQITAKDEEQAEEKAQKKIEDVQLKSTGAKGLLDQFDWDVTVEDDSLEYEVEAN